MDTTADYKLKKEALKNIMKDAMKKKLDKDRNPYPEIKTPPNTPRASGGKDTKWDDAMGDNDKDDLVLRIRGMRRA